MVTETLGEIALRRSVVGRKEGLAKADGGGGGLGYAGTDGDKHFPN